MHTEPELGCLIDFKSYWKHDDHVIGQCLVDPTEQFFWINVPKNASSWGKSVLYDLGWHDGDYIHDNMVHKTALIFTRDPLSRWISGITEYLNRLQYIELEDLHGKLLQLILDKITFDSHTEKQKNFIHNMDTNLLICFSVDQNLEQNFNHWLSLSNQGVEKTLLPYKDRNIGRQKDLYQFVGSYLKNHPDAEKKIIEYFHDDYALINQYNDWNLYYQPR